MLTRVKRNTHKHKHALSQSSHTFIGGLPGRKQKKVEKVGQVKRPMNAFLIFCKRERGSVKHKYPTLENREVTKILGDWWASLDPAEKSMYSALANQHKENIRNQTELKHHPLKMPAGKGKKLPSNSQPAIIPGKLADESQLGGLSSLLISTEVVPREETKPPLPIPLKKRYRDGIYTTQEAQPPPNTVTPKEEKTEEILPSNESSEDEESKLLKIWRSHILEENNNVKDTRTRACKGQRYREFMWTNYTTRRKTNRWELNQDKTEISTPVKRIKTAKSDTNTDKTSTKISHPIMKADGSQEYMDSGSSSENEKKNTKEESSNDSVKCIGNNSEVLKINIASLSKGADSLPNDAYNDQMNCDNETSDTKLELDKMDKTFKNEKKPENIVTGSRKRKVRRQEIRRLNPGNFCDELVAEPLSTF